MLKWIEEELPKTKGILLLKYGAKGCKPCEAMKPIFDELVEEGYNIKQINTSEYPDLVEKYNLYTFPQLELYVDGQPLTKTRGQKTKEEIIRFYKLGE